MCGKEGFVYAWHYDGTPVLDSSVFFSIYPAEVWSSPALGDINNDGFIELAFAARRSTNNLYILNHYGQIMPGWPKSLPGGVLGSVVFADIDLDGDLEIFVWTLNADVYAFDHIGNGLYSPSGLLKDLPGSGFGTLAIGDIDRDGNPEMICCGGSGSDSLYVWRSDGSYMVPFPIYIQTGNLKYSVVLGNVLGDDRLEIAFYADNTELVYLVNADGNIVWSKYLGALADVEGSPILCDINCDGKSEVICGHQAGFVVLDSLGNICNAMIDTVHDAKLPAVISQSSNSVRMILVGSTDWHIYAYSFDQPYTPGFPIRLGNRLESAPAVFDIDGDGYLELMLGSNEYKFYCFDLDYDRFHWPKFRYDPFNSGNSNSDFYPAISDNAIVIGPPSIFVKALPNIFKERTLLTYRRPGGQVSRLKIYNVAGQLVRDFEVQCSGELIWDGLDSRNMVLPAGIYFVKIDCGDKTYCEKVIKIK
ncbi:hypothetical protein A2Y85_05195 [candidate division WOR-3 bacterium RBG_13_43_14]|uniref:Secretion system C-terminal sorting domain-containing protein n=1 Tax=candidate division WOR-3 bacterium RBG_13_43_14 TaxID=1802590 RepID=A0A1F4U8H6_UNCW3|nr:MAG: hypothetical protein A2Y85_05195 [candidate division WOR-3 bacterium RBG_13_43_14]